MDVSRQPSGAGQIFSDTTWGGGSGRPSPTKACLLTSESGHVSVRLPVVHHTLYSGARISFLGSYFKLGTDGKLNGRPRPV